MTFSLSLFLSFCLEIYIYIHYSWSLDCTFSTLNKLWAKLLGRYCVLPNRTPFSAFRSLYLSKYIYEMFICKVLMTLTWQKSNRLFRYGLCGDLFKCNCLDISNICKHIHKVHSLLIRNVIVDVSKKEEPLEDDYQLNYTTATTNGQIEEIAKLKKTELDAFHENINRLTEPVDVPVVESLRLETQIDNG